MNAMIVHVPKGFDSQDWSHNYINIASAGAFSIANYASCHGHPTKVMNSAVYGSRQRALEVLLGRMDELGCQVVGLPIHWHLGAYDVIRAAERIKAERPETRIVLGGHTASVYSEQLLGRSSAVDAVIRGDGELPFCQYLDELTRPDGQADLARVPNLSWRSARAVVTNELSHAASAEQYDCFDFRISSAICDPREYTNGPTMMDAVAGRTFDLWAQPIGERVFFVNIGRGCSFACVYCAGSNVAFRRYYRREHVAVRAVDSVIRDVADAYRLGFRKVHICFDPEFPDKASYYEGLFRRLKEQVGDDLTLLFEAYQLPGEGFLELCSECFRETVLILSPGFFELETMRRYMGYSYSLAELEECLTKIERRPGCQAFVYFAVTPLEDWSPAGLKGKAETMRTIRDRHGCRVGAMPIYAEPGSPWVDFPDRFGGLHLPLGFDDFWQQWQRPLGPWNDALAGVDGLDGIMAELASLMHIDALPDP